MAIFRLTASADNTITNGYKIDGSTRATASNAGAADSLEMYSLSGALSTSSLEKSRVLINFPLSEISSKRTNYIIPASGSCKFYLKLFNVEHPLTIPTKFYALVRPISSSWVEGNGLDLDNYTDSGWNGTTGYGSSWKYRDSGSAWTAEGGDYISGYDKSVYFEKGTEDLEVDVTDIVEAHLAGTITTYGFGVMLSGAFEDGTTSESFFTKRFSARSSEYFYNRPVVEARWEPQITDDYPTYSISNAVSELTHSSNYINIYLYNQVNGTKVPLKSTFTTGNLEVAFFTGSQLVGGGINAVTSPQTYSKKKIDNSTFKFQFVLDRTDSDLASLTNGTASKITASYKIYTTSSTLYYETGTLSLVESIAEQYSTPQTEYTFKVLNIKPSYVKNEVAVFNIFSRPLNWSPTVYTKAVQTLSSTRHKNLYYKIVRTVDKKVIIDFGTGSLKYTRTDYDRSYNFFSLDMSLLEPGFMYEIHLGLDYENQFKEVTEKFKFRVD